MNNEKSSINSDEISKNDEKSKEQKPLAFHNPLDPNDDRKITQEDIDNEQKFKEALSERD